MAYCLPSQIAQKFTQAIHDGSFNPDAYAKKDSTEERQAYVAKFVGEDEAKSVNTELESKMLLADYKRGMVTAVKKMTGITEPAQRDMISKIEKLSNLLSPQQEKFFLEDLAERKLGTHVSMDEANTLAGMSKDLSDAKANIQPDEPAGSANRLDYGAKRVALENYVNDLKLSNEPNALKSFASNVKRGKITAAAKDASKIGAFAKSMKAVGDISSLFRQGFKTLWTNPTTWAVNAVKTFGDVGKQLSVPGDNDDIMNAVKADIYSRPNSLNGMYAKTKIDIGNTEEAIPTSLPEKIPAFGRLFKATQTGFEGFLYRTRADVADKYIQIAHDSGVDLTDQSQLRGIGKLVNSLTGRGSLGKYESEGKLLNNIFFSPKFIVSNFDLLTGHQIGSDKTAFVRKQGALATLKVIGGTAAILAIAHAIQPKSVELDPRSSNFGKIKIGKISFDVTGGSGSIVTLAARLIENSTKSTTSGKIEKLNTGAFGAETSQDVITNYLTNKESPAAAVLMDIANRSTFTGQKLGWNAQSLEAVANDAITPFPVQNVMEATPQTGLPDAIVAELADALGLYETIPEAPTKK